MDRWDGLIYIIVARSHDIRRLVAELSRLDYRNGGDGGSLGSLLRISHVTIEVLVPVFREPKRANYQKV